MNISENLDNLQNIPPHNQNAECSDDDDNDSTSSEEIEPKLKYQRMSNDLKNILTKDAVSCIAVHPKFVCVGTLWGMIHILDHQGNNVGTKELQAHTVAVNQISIDDNGDFIASCSDDGKVFVHGLYSAENNHNIEMGRSVKSISIDPSYFKAGSGRRFITGDERLVLHEKTFLSRIKSTHLSDAEGNVNNLRWHGQFLAWATDIGVRIFHVSSRTSLGLIKWPRSPGALPEDYRCNLCWKSTYTLLIGWVDSVRICNIRRRSPAELLGRELPEYVVESVCNFQTDFYICGIAPLDTQIVLLGYHKELEEDGTARRPQLYVIEPRPSEYCEICTDSLTLRGYQDYKASDYHLECLIEENIFFIISPKDLVIATPYDADDRVNWLIRHSKFEDAMEAVTKFEGRDLKTHSLLKVGRAYLDHLLAIQHFNKAAQLCVKILGKDKELWEEDIFKFARFQQLRAIAKFIPIGDNALDPHIYEMILYEYLKLEPTGFLTLIKEWSPTLYNLPAVINAVLEHLLVTTNEKSLLLEALAILYSHETKYDKSLAMYLKLKHKDVFQLIHKHNLFHSIHDMIEELMELDAEQAIQLFLEKDRIAAEIIVKKLEKNEKYLYMYLDALDKKDFKGQGQKYHGILVKLYAKLAREKLLPLLRRSHHYPIQEALDICKQNQYYPEMVLLLGRIGNTKEALALITRELNDIEQAIDFCKEHDDLELWEDLINYSLDKPDFITFLLQRIGTYVDPRILIQKIENEMKIPGLQTSLVRMMRDYHLQVSVQEGCKKILVSDYFNLHEKLVRMQSKPIIIDDDVVCGACHRKIIVTDLARVSNLVVFYCKHTFHEECLPNFDMMKNCIICNSTKMISQGFNN